MSAGAIVSPLLKMIFSGLATKAVGNLLNTDTPFQQSLGGINTAMQAQMPNLIAEAQGIPSLATKNAMKNLDTEIGRMQQSYGASMARANPSMKSTTTPVREGQKGYQEAKIRGMSDIMGNAQQNAQNQLMSLYSGSQYPQMMGDLQKRKDERDAYGSVMGLWTTMQKFQNDEKAKSIFNPLWDSLIDMIKDMFSKGDTGA